MLDSKGPFHFHFTSLLGKRQGISVRAVWPETALLPPPKGIPEHSWFGKDPDDAFLFAMTHNLEGYNVRLGMRDDETPHFGERDILFQEWLAVNIFVDNRLIEEKVALEHANNMNIIEFDGTGSILKSGEQIWILVPISKTTTSIKGGIRKDDLKGFFISLSIRWNLIAGIYFTFEVNCGLCGQDILMPAAGTWNYCQDSSSLVNWISIGDRMIRESVLTKIARTPSPYTKVGMTDGIRIRDNVPRYKSVMKIDTELDIVSLVKYLESRGRLYNPFGMRKIYPVRMSEEDLEMAIYLRAIYFATQKDIEYVLRVRYAELEERQPIGDEQEYHDRLILKADYYAIDALSSVQIDSCITERKAAFERILPFCGYPAHVPWLKDILKELMIANGPVIHLAHSGCYVLQMQRQMLRQTLFRHYTSNRVHLFTAFPCYFKMRKGWPAADSGTILMSGDISDSFYETVNQFQPETPLATYFWFHARRFNMAPLDSKLSDGSPITENRLIAWFRDYQPIIYRLLREHRIDRYRKSGYYC